MDSVDILVYNLSHVHGSFLKQACQKGYGPWLLVSNFFSVSFPSGILRHLFRRRNSKKQAFLLTWCSTCASQLHIHTQTFSESFFLSVPVGSFSFGGLMCLFQDSSHTQQVPDQRQIMQIVVPVPSLSKNVTLQVTQASSAWISLQSMYG